MEFKLETRTGRHEISATVNILGAAFGQPETAVLLMPDVTSRNRIESALRRSEERLASALAVSRVGFYEWDIPDNRVTYNDQMIEDWGFPPGTVSTPIEAAFERIHPDDRARVSALIDAAVETHEPFQTDYRVCRMAGQVVWIEVRGQVHYDNAGKPLRFFGTSVDVTERRRTEEALRTDIETRKHGEMALRAANLAAESANAAKSAFLANMSHEIRTPLGAILGFVGLMKNPKTTAYSLASYISVIERNSDHQLRVIDDILDLSKVEAGQMQIERIEFSLSDVLADFASLMGFRAREKAVEFDLVAVSALPGKVISDPTRIRQILTNVVGNALKFTERGSVRLEIGYREGQLVFTVTDTGVGIPEGQREGLFQPFSQGDISTTRRFGGTGLGLVLTRRLCEALGGRFALVRSTPGTGSVFEAHVAVTTADGTEMTPPERVSFVTPPAMRTVATAELSGLRVLVAEDSPDNQTLFRITLEDVGADVTVVGDGEVCVSTAASQSFDAIVMDIQMPRMDGHTAARLLRQRGFTGPLVALTADAMKEERERCMQSGFSDFLAKPIRKEALVEVLGRVSKPVRPEVVFVEDDADVRDWIAVSLELEDYRVTAFGTAEGALAHLDTTRGPTVVMTDLTLPGMSGDELARAIGRRPDRGRFWIVLASGWDDIARRAADDGADASLRKPFDTDAVVAAIKRFTRRDHRP